MADLRSTLVGAAVATVAVGGVRAAAHQLTEGGGAPTAEFSVTPSTPVAGDPVTFDGTLSFDPDGTIASYQWNIGGVGYTGPTATHTFSAAGDYTVSLVVTDDEGRTSTAQQTVPVSPPPNEAPVADFDWSPSSPTAGESVTFDGSLSSDPDGTIASYSWSIAGASYTGETASHTFSASGSYTAELTVVDDEGGTNTASKTVSVGTVANEAPTADFDVLPVNPVVGESVTFDGTLSSDPDGTIASYSWSIAGTTYTTSTPQHTFQSSGDKTVSLTVTDDDGATDTATTTVTVDPEPNSAPTADFEWSPTSPVVGEAVTFDGSLSFDSDGTIASYDWDIAGTAYTGQQPTHTFQSSGDKSVSLTVTDDDGATNSITTTVTVASANEAPTADFSYSPTDPVAGESVTFDGTLSSDPDGTIASYDWDINGSIYSGSTVTHTFSADGTYTATLTVTDDDGATDSLQRSISVGGETNVAYGEGGYGQGGYGGVSA